MAYEITTTKQDEARRIITLEIAGRIERARVRRERFERIARSPWVIVAVLIACVLIASYGDTISGVYPSI